MTYTRFLFAVCMVLLAFTGSSQLTIIVDQVPENTPEHSEIFIAGDFQGWDAGDPDYRLSRNEEDYIIDLFLNNGTDLEFKFTRGSWVTVEGNTAGQFLPNRNYTYEGPQDTLILQILSWEDLGGNTNNSTAAENVFVYEEDYYIPQLDRSRRIWIYLPPDYDSSSRSYPVIYMHDGQNVFDAATSFVGEWEVDETLNELFQQGDDGVIVVAIDNGGSERLIEYSPWVNPQYGGGKGDAYVRFIIETLKPDIDNNFRTKRGAKDTGMIGSSMGGLISLYAGLEYPEVFGRIGSFSPAYWFSSESFQHAQDQPMDENLKIYSIAGSEEGDHFLESVLIMQNILEEKGYSQDEAVLFIHPGGEHSEWYWAREFADAYLWLFAEDQTSNVTELFDPVNIYPNPTHNLIKVEYPGAIENMEYIITDLNGRIIGEGLLEDNQIRLPFDMPDTVFLQLRSGEELVYSEKIIVSSK